MQFVKIFVYIFPTVFFQVRHYRCVLYDQYMWSKIIDLYSHTQLCLLEVLVVFLATCFGSYTEPPSGWSSEWFVCTIVHTTFKVPTTEHTKHSED
jgi:hypothetical protein